MKTINIKPLSVNQAWQGRRFKTDLYKKYCIDVAKLLPLLAVPDGFLKVYYEFGVSNMASDVDNLVKCFQDCLQNKYDFNDSKIKEFTACKIKVKKGDEFIKFNIHYDDNWNFQYKLAER